MIVADANLFVYLFLPGEHTEAAQKAYRADPVWSAPLLWRSEFRNVISVFERRGAIDGNLGIRAFDAAARAVQGREYTVETSPVLELARESNCSAYDCEYVALARDLDVPLVTSDQQLLNAFDQTAVSIEKIAEDT